MFGTNNLLPVVGVGIGGALWVAYRNEQRRKLLRMLEENAAVFAARVYAKAAGLGGEHAWLVKPGGLRERADELITYTNMTSADDAFAELKASLPKEPPAEPGVLPGLLNQGIDTVAEAMGVKVPESVRQQAHQQVEGTGQSDAIEGFITSAQGLWQWALGSEEKPDAKPNPAVDVSWDYYLAGLALE